MTYKVCSESFKTDCFLRSDACPYPFYQQDEVVWYVRRSACVSVLPEMLQLVDPQWKWVCVIDIRRKLVESLSRWMHFLDKFATSEETLFYQYNSETICQTSEWHPSMGDHYVNPPSHTPLIAIEVLVLVNVAILLKAPLLSDHALIAFFHHSSLETPEKEAI